MRKMIYAILDTIANLVKFGVSKNPKNRLSDIRVGNAHVVMVGICKADDDYEAEGHIHAMLRHSRVSGEWFRVNPTVVSVAWFIQNNSRLGRRDNIAVLSSTQSRAVLSSWGVVSQNKYLKEYKPESIVVLDAIEEIARSGKFSRTHLSSRIGILTQGQYRKFRERFLLNGWAFSNGNNITSLTPSGVRLVKKVMQITGR